MFKSRVIPLTLKTAYSCILSIGVLTILRWLINFSSSQDALLDSLVNYLLLAAILLGVLFVTFLEKPNKALSLFVWVCDVLIAFAVLTSFFVQDNFRIYFFCGILPVFLLIIVLSYPKTAHYMRDKYYEAIRAQQKGILQ